MKSSAEAIEKVLAGLRDTEVPAGMECRILTAVGDHAWVGSRSVWDWRRFGPIWLVASAFPSATRSFVFVVAMVGMFVVALAIPRLRRVANAPLLTRMNSAPAASVSSMASEIMADSAPLPSADKSSVQFRVTTKTRRARIARSRDSLALRELSAASLPAPPLPLTEQEKLLLRVAHTGDPEQLAMLNPEVRRKWEAEGDAEFQSFFERSK